MENEEYITPINHGGLSATASTVAGAAGGAAKGGALTWLGWVAALTVIGVVAGIAFPPLLAAISGAGVSGISAGIAGAASALWSVVSSAPFIGGVVGLVVGVGTGMIPTAIGAGIGALKGGSHAYSRVNTERAAAAQMQMEMAAQMPPQGNPYQITPEEYALMQARMRGGNEGIRADHAQHIAASRAAADTKPPQLSA